MNKETKILVPIDFSACSENAAIFARQLAGKIKADCELLNVAYLETGTFKNFASGVEEIGEKGEQLDERINKFIQKISENVPTSLEEISSIQSNTEMGSVETIICDVASRNKVDYIVMGTQGENSTFDKYLGSVASSVLKKAPCPVLVIPENTKLEKKLTLGYATDFLDADPFEIWKAMQLFEPFQPKIKCVHFKEPGDQSEEKMKELERYFADNFPELKVELYSLPAKDKVKDMNDFIDKHNINMLIMYKPKRSFFESIFHRSYTQKMAKHSIIPLLVFVESE